MDLALWGFSAAQFWQVPLIGRYHAARGVGENGLGNSEASGNGPGKIEYFVTSRADRSFKIKNKIHLCAHAPLQDEVITINAIRTASPELAFLQICNDLTRNSKNVRFDVTALHWAIEIGNLFCSRITPHGSGNFESSMSDQPVTSVEKLVSALEKCENYPGVSLVRAAIQYIRDGFRSLVEIHLFMILHLPYRYGGLGFPLPEVNKQFSLNHKQQRALMKSYIEVDFYYSKAKLAIEYDSYQVHSNARSFSSDGAKSLELKNMNISVLNIHTTQIYDLYQFQAIVTYLSQHLKKRIRPRNPSFCEHFAHLHSLLPRRFSTNNYPYADMRERELDDFFRYCGYV